MNISTSKGKTLTRFVGTKAGNIRRPDVRITLRGVNATVSFQVELVLPRRRGDRIGLRLGRAIALRKLHVIPLLRLRCNLLLDRGEIERSCPKVNRRRDFARLQEACRLERGARPTDFASVAMQLPTVKRRRYPAFPQAAGQARKYRCS
jgi:hypothetical protein